MFSAHKTPEDFTRWCKKTYPDRHCNGSQESADHDEREGSYSGVAATYRHPEIKADHRTYNSAQHASSCRENF